MIRNTVVNIVNYFYPIGNTPAVCLTQDLHPKKDADLLLLGCGDARNVLFTYFADPERKIDVTCCDIEAAIIARNILLYTLIIDDTEGVRLQQIWNVNYHWKLDKTSLDLLRGQAEKLVSVSETAVEWRASVYGKIIRFCDTQSLIKVREFWAACSSPNPIAGQPSKDQKVQEENIAKAQRTRRAVLGQGATVTGARSAAPTGFLAISDLHDVTVKWWEEGLTTSGNTSSKAHYLNPAFLATSDQRLILHYGSEPLLGFQLATAYVSLVGKEKGSLSSPANLVACAYEHFRMWSQAFRKSVSQGTLLRFCVADALALALTLRRGDTAHKDMLTANISCNNWTCKALVLDEAEYAHSGYAAPRFFDVIDTSNLVDHLGLLNILPACATLLTTNSWSTIYTENLVQNDSNEKERFVSLLGASSQTVALILGLSPCEYWTNATNCAEDESIMDILHEARSKSKIGGSTQIRSRLRWKRVYGRSEDKIFNAIHMNFSQVAELLIKLYNHMFKHEDALSLLADLSTSTLSKRTNPYYNRASFVLLLKFMQQTIATDWPKCLEEMMSQIFSGFHRLSIGANFAQELMLFMHMFDIDRTQLPNPNRSTNTNMDSKLAALFRSWPDTPAQVCVTLRVPRTKLQIFTSKPVSKIGTPTLCCDIEGGGIASRPWSNRFSSVTVAFGDAQLSYCDHVPFLRIEEDKSNWWGSSDMFVSAFVPTWMLLQPEKTVPTVRCCLLSTPHSAQAFFRDLGLNLEIFKADLTSSKVTISKHMPGADDVPLVSFGESALQPEPQQSLTVTLSKDTAIERLIHRTSYRSQPPEAKLCDRSTAVSVHFHDAWRACIKIGNESETQISFPIPTDHLRHKVRIARQSSYVEVEVSPWNPLAETSSPLLFPTIPPRKSNLAFSSPVPWTATRVNLDVMPAIDTKDKRKLRWLTTHASMMFSTKERRVRELGMAGRTLPGTMPNLRVEIKEGLFTMMMIYTGLQGQQTNIFGLSRDNNGINVLFLVSTIKLDLNNRTVVLDAAAIPLSNEMNKDSKVRSFYQNIAKQGVMQIKVSHDELRAWKSLLPGLVERCRSWEHTSSCEYASTGEVPLKKGLEDGHSPLCTCGIGKFPVDYLRGNSNHSDLKYILKRYATRVAISPIFAVPYVEDCFLAGTDLSELQSIKSSAAKQGCGHCGSEGRKNVEGHNTKLLICSRCRQVNYCSVECQKADWKNHKGSCSKQ